MSGEHLGGAAEADKQKAEHTKLTVLLRLGQPRIPKTWLGVVQLSPILTMMI